MSRKDAILRLYQRLALQRDELLEKLGHPDNSEHEDVGDLADVASEGSRNELNSQLASIETRELRLIEQAMQMIQDGTYGRCDGCSQPIPVARLQALPFSVLCVECQRRTEDGELVGDSEVNWDMACEYEVRLSDQEFRLDDLERDI